MNEIIYGCRECRLPLGECCDEAIDDPIELILTDGFFCQFDETVYEVVDNVPAVLGHQVHRIPLMINLEFTNLYPSQEYLSGENLIALRAARDSGVALLFPRLVQYRDGFAIVDGHHRLALDILSGVTEIACDITGNTYDD